MAGESRRIRFLLSPRNPLDAEILAWIDTLPRSGRGTEMLAHLRVALIAYIRSGPKVGGPEIQRATVAPIPRSSPYPQLRPSSVQMSKDGTQAPGRADAGESSRALAKHLLKDFG